MLENRHDLSLNRVATYFNEQLRAILPWLFPGKFPDAAHLIGGRVTPNQEVINAVNGQTAQKQDLKRIATTEFRGRIPVTVIQPHGALDSFKYQALIDQARKVYERGGRYIVLDMGDVPAIGMSGLFALYSVAVLLRGEEPPDPAAGWHAYHAMVHGLEGGMGWHLKLLNPPPRVDSALERAGFKSFLEVHPNLEAAIASF